MEAYKEVYLYIASFRNRMSLNKYIQKNEITIYILTSAHTAQINEVELVSYASYSLYTLITISHKTFFTFLKWSTHCIVM